MNRKDLQKRIEHIKTLLDPKTAKRQKQRERSKGIAKGLAVGTLLGGIAGVFLAPDKGENTRKKAKEELDKAKEVLETNMKEGRSKLSNFFDDDKGIFKDRVVVLKNQKKDQDMFEEDED